MARMGGKGGRGGRGGKPQGKKRVFFRRRKVCKFCAEKLEYIDYKDANLLRKFSGGSSTLQNQIGSNLNNHPGLAGFSEFEQPSMEDIESQQNQGQEAERVAGTHTGKAEARKADAERVNAEFVNVVKLLWEDLLARIQELEDSKKNGATTDAGKGSQKSSGLGPGGLF